MWSRDYVLSRITASLSDKERVATARLLCAIHRELYSRLRQILQCIIFKAAQRLLNRFSWRNTLWQNLSLRYIHIVYLFSPIRNGNNIRVELMIFPDDLLLKERRIRCTNMWSLQLKTFTTKRRAISLWGKHSIRTKAIPANESRRSTGFTTHLLSP